MASGGAPPLPGTAAAFSILRQDIDFTKMLLKLLDTPDAIRVSGSVAVSARNTFNGAGLFLQRNLCCNFDPSDPCSVRGYRVDLLAGYRYFGLNDNFQVREDLVSTGQTGVPPGTRLIVADQFRTVNTFNGGLLGLSGSARMGNSSWK